MSDRLRYALWRAFPGVMFGIGPVAGAAIFLPLLDKSEPAWPLWLLIGLTLGVVGGFIGSEYGRHGLRYFVEGLAVTSYPDSIPPVTRNEFSQLYDEWWERWEPWATRNGYTRRALMKGGEVRITPRAPSTGWYRDESSKPEGEEERRLPDVDHDTPGIQSHGQHWPLARLVLVHDKKAFGSTMEHELDLMAAEVAAVQKGPLQRESPMDSIEQEKIDWMTEKGIR